MITHETLRSQTLFFLSRVHPFTVFRLTLHPSRLAQKKIGISNGIVTANINTSESLPHTYMLRRPQIDKSQNPILASSASKTPAVAVLFTQATAAAYRIEADALIIRAAHPR
jgi:hypothetical protein